MYVKRYLALLFSATFAVSAFGAVSLVTDQADIDQTFKYTGADAKVVAIAGEFSNWSVLPMAKDGSGGWALTLHLKPGYYGYKFIVDGEWVLDPASPARKTVNGIEDSAVSVGGVMPVSEPAATAPVPVVSEAVVPTSFLYVDASAKTVHLAGDFNSWLDNTDGKVTGHNEWLLQNIGAGNWTLTVPLKTGKHSFKYVIDGGARWETNPRLPVDGDGNSVVEVRVPVPAPVAQSVSGASFAYTDTSAKSVSVAGEFNQWNTTANPMKKSEQGLWTVTIPLKPGKYLYKLVVDGAWKTDPSSPDGPEDGYGGKNSVKVVGQ